MVWWAPRKSGPAATKNARSGNTRARARRAAERAERDAAKKRASRRKEREAAAKKARRSVRPRTNVRRGSMSEPSAMPNN